MNYTITVGCSIIYQSPRSLKFPCFFVSRQSDYFAEFQKLAVADKL